MKTYVKSLVSALMICVLCAACSPGPAKIEPIVEIGPSKTAFLVPLEGAAKEGQGKFMSEEYLQSAKVATKRVVIPVRKRITGKFPILFGDYKWIPTVMVIEVDRTPETREWTREEGTGTSKRNQAIAVESKDSISFKVGVNTTTAIIEEDAAKFLYNFAGKHLTSVTDENVRGSVQTVLGREFGTRTLNECRVDKAEIFEICFKEVKAEFKKLGVTIMSLGHAEGLIYKDGEIQKAINENFKLEMDVIAAQNERKAQAERNLKDIEKAQAERDAAKAFAEAAQARTQQVDLEIRKIDANARLELAKKFNGQMPANILPQGSSLLLGLDTSK